MRGFHLFAHPSLLRLLLICLALFSMTACGKPATPAEQIVGKWQRPEFKYNDFPILMNYEFFTDGSVTISTSVDKETPIKQKGTYTMLENGIMTITVEEKTDTMETEFKDNTLFITQKIKQTYDQSGNLIKAWDYKWQLERIK